MDETPRYIRHVGEVLREALADTHDDVTYLDRGGMSILFTADHRKLRQRHAIKVFTHDAADLDDAFRRFEREAVQIAKLNHPNIRRIHDARDLPDARLSFMIMDFIDGDSLSVKLKRESISAGEGIAIARQITDALGAAHDQGIIHRDIKPGNVLLDREGKAYLADFGIARDSADPALTQANAVPGTERFMAPELFDGVPASVRSDLYALGGLLYRMWLGEDPYPRIGLRLKAEIDAGVAHEPVSAVTRRADLPPRIGELMAQLVAIDPARRPGGCREVLRILDGARDTELADPTMVDVTERTIWRADVSTEPAADPSGALGDEPTIDAAPSPGATVTPAEALARPRWLRWVAGAGAVLGLILIALWGWRMSTGGDGPATDHLTPAFQVPSELEVGLEEDATLPVAVTGGEGRELTLVVIPEGPVACGTPRGQGGVQNSDGSVVQVIEGQDPRPVGLELTVALTDDARPPVSGALRLELRDGDAVVHSERVAVRGSLGLGGPGIVSVAIDREGGRGGERVGEPARVRISVTNEGAEPTGEVDVRVIVESGNADVDDTSHTLNAIASGATESVLVAVTPRAGGQLTIAARVGDGNEVAEVTGSTSWSVASPPAPPPSGPRTITIRCRVEGLGATDEGRLPVFRANGREIGRRLVFELEARNGDTIDVSARKAGYTYERQGELITVRPGTDEYQVVFTAKSTWDWSGGRDGGEG